MTFLGVELDEEKMTKYERYFIGHWAIVPHHSGMKLPPMTRRRRT